MNPQNGRFNSVDPFMGRKNNPISSHRYLYGNANPVVFTDSSGEFGLGAAMAMVRLLYTINQTAIVSYGGKEENLSATEKSKSSTTGLVPGTNYCGPGPYKATFPPIINCVDRVCYRHDLCYKKCGLEAKTRFKFWSLPEEDRECAVLCDWNAFYRATCIMNNSGCGTPSGGVIARLVRGFVETNQAATVAVFFATLYMSHL